MIMYLENREALNRVAAEIFAKEAQRAVAEHGRFSVLLSGGETPQRTYELLAEEPLREQVPWDRVHVFWGDERCVPVDDSRSNYRMARKALLERVPLPPAQIHPILCVDSPQQAAAGYSEVIRSYFGAGPHSFDLVYLGLGDDGHTASLFPGSTALDERELWTAVTRRPGESIERITLTAPLINQAALIVFLVTGAGKAEVLRKVLEKTAGEPSLPAQLIRHEKGMIRWLVDRDAAGLLRQEQQ